MSALTAFEVQSLRDGVWKIETVTDDKDMAIFEAQRIIQSPHVPKVRVVQEDFDPETDRYRTKVIFNRSPAQRAGSMARAPAPRPDPMPSEVKPRPQPKQPGGMSLALIFGGLTLAGIMIVIGLRYLATAI